MFPLLIFIALGLGTIARLHSLAASFLVNRASLRLVKDSVDNPDPIEKGRSPESLALYRRAADFEPVLASHPLSRYLEFRLEGPAGTTVRFCPDAPYICALGLELGERYRQAAQHEDAIDVFRWLSEVCPETFEGYTSRALVERGRAEFATAAELLEVATTLRPLDFCGTGPVTLSEIQRVNLAKAYYELGEVYEEAGRPDKAIAALEKASDTYPPGEASPWMYSRLGTLYYRSQSFQKARWAFEQALILKPDLEEPRAYLDKMSRSGQPDSKR